MKYLRKIYFSLGWVTSFLYIYIYIYIYIYVCVCVCVCVHSSPYLFACGGDRITCYAGADDLTGEPGDASVP